jgi:hypothetical protein
MAEAGLAALPSLRGTPLKGRLRLAKKMGRSASLNSVDRFITNCTYTSMRDQKSALYSAGLMAEVSASDPSSRHRAAFDRVQRRRLPASDALSRHQDFYGQPEPHL